jgi:hypothetical protein
MTTVKILALRANWSQISTIWIFSGGQKQGRNSRFPYLGGGIRNRIFTLGLLNVEMPWVQKGKTSKIDSNHLAWCLKVIGIFWKFESSIKDDFYLIKIYSIQPSRHPLTQTRDCQVETESIRIGCGYWAGPVPPPYSLLGGTSPSTVFVIGRDQSLHLICYWVGPVPPPYSLLGGTSPSTVFLIGRDIPSDWFMIPRMYARVKWCSKFKIHEQQKWRYRYRQVGDIIGSSLSWQGIQPFVHLYQHLGSFNDLWI